MKLPSELGPIHFVGIGGIGMSGIAEVLLNLGYTVQGSDASDNANVKRLRERGAKVFIGHDAEHLGDAAVVVVSTAIKRDNPELAAARARAHAGGAARRDARRADAPQAMRRHRRHPRQDDDDLAGRDAARRGGLRSDRHQRRHHQRLWRQRAAAAAGDWMVVEADESDGTFLKLPADVAIVTNIDPEHLDHFKTFDAIKDAFLAFVENLPFYGFAVMCLDHPTVQELVGRIEDRRVITYGENPQADVRLLDVDLAGGVTRFNVLIRDRKTGATTLDRQAALPMPGHHNALNATAAIAVAHELKVASTLSSARRSPAFGGVKRRFTRTGDWNGVDDLRRLRPSPRRDRRRAARRARRRPRAR